ncbi:MFS transporter [Dysgonomonas sp. Marseille-P4677]|uniref:MFS transporter n=1 Tax=Dysgonomonas sp. Marseille-P4677 TaxID=2364790 RepID=UPI001911757F|nr:MFS transporter [Dysgonomonas sp. Marseille-P4677]MBK5721187.1 MFS transporter [Dysgonomonas sp. Marseille-P4677]
MTEILPSTYSKQRIRYAVMALFIAQGLCFASWASRLPDIKKDFNVESYLHYGLLMFLIPIGKFIAIPLVGFLLPRIGSKKTVFISIVGYTLSLFIVSLVPGVTGLGITMFLFGVFWNMTDISLNTQAIEVERIYGRPIIATFHASWSLAACIGALIGYGMINLGIGTFYHFMGMTVLALIMILINYKYLQEQSSTSAEDVKEEVVEQPKAKKLRMPETLLIQLGLVWLLALIVENTMFEWSDVYFQSVIKAPESLQVGFLVFMIMMFSGRMLTNYAYRIWQKNTVLQIAGALILIGFITSSLFIHYSDTLIIKVIINSIGFMLIGLGISCVVPTLYSIVGDKAKTPVGTALTIMSSISFVGPLVAPLLVGAISDQYGLEWAYLTVGLLGALIIAIAAFGKTLRR